LFCIYDVMYNKDLGDWVKVRSTTWYSQFHVTKYNDSNWMEHFKVSRDFVF
jgi:hypothetical protein